MPQDVLRLCGTGVLAVYVIVEGSLLQLPCLSVEASNPNVDNRCQREQKRGFARLTLTSADWSPASSPSTTTTSEPNVCSVCVTSEWLERSRDFVLGLLATGISGLCEYAQS